MTNIHRALNPMKPTVAALSVFLASSCSAWAQSAAGACKIALEYSPVQTPPVIAPTSVPGLTLVGLGILGALVTAVAWSKRHKWGVNDRMSVALMSGAVVLSVAGGGSLVNVVRAAGPYEFANPNGGSVTDLQVAYADPAPVLTLTNTSGRPIKITANGNAAETGTCSVGATIAPGSSCTTVATCSAPPLQLLSVVADPKVTCDFSQPPLYTKSWEGSGGSATYSVFPPKLDSGPVFDPSGTNVTTTFTYTPGPELIIDQTTGQPTNFSEAAAGNAVVTSQAPSGYAFDTSTPPSTSKVWNLPYQGCITAASVV